MPGTPPNRMPPAWAGPFSAYGRSSGRADAVTAMPGGVRRTTLGLLLLMAQEDWEGYWALAATVPPEALVQDAHMLTLAMLDMLRVTYQGNLVELIREAAWGLAGDGCG